MNTRAKIFLAISIFAIGMTGCGDTKSSSNSSNYSNSSTSGLSSENKDRYNNLSAEGKKSFDDQMRAYDKANKR